MYIVFKKNHLRLPIQCVELGGNQDLRFYLVIMAKEQLESLEQPEGGPVTFNSGHVAAGNLEYTREDFDPYWFNQHCDSPTLGFAGLQNRQQDAQMYYGWVYLWDRLKENAVFTIVQEFQSNEEAYQALPLYTGVD